MKRLVLSVWLVLLGGGVSLAAGTVAITDAPHNQSRNIACNDCHSYSLWWQFSPVFSDPGLRIDKTTAICLKCHDGSQSILAAAHSSDGIGDGFHRIELGAWKRTCTDCHSPHFQEQLNWYGDADVPNDRLFVATGVMGNITDNLDGTTTFTYVIDSNPASSWDDNPLSWTQKSGTTNRSLIVALPISTPVTSGIEPGFTYEMTSADASTVTVTGAIDTAFDGASFGLLYGQLLRDEVQGVAGPKRIKFFDPLEGDFVDTSVNREGLCQVCHIYTNHFLASDTPPVDVDPAIPLPDPYNTDPATDHSERTDDQGKVGAEARCSFCHSHIRGWAPGSDGGQHPLHLAMTNDCNICHTSGVPDPLTEVGCTTCHNDGKGGDPNDMDYRNHWNDQDPTYSLTCNSCHNGRLDLEDVADTVKYTHLPADSQCDQCHQENTAPVPPAGLCAFTVGQDCFDCHDGPGAGSQMDYQEEAVGMRTNGHTRLASSRWVRQYPCYYCHTGTVNASGALTSLHVNQQVDVAIDSKWYLTGFVTGDPPPDPPKYTGTNPDLAKGEVANTCYNVYCHSDGTTNQPEMHPYPWTGDHEACNSCHGHQPGSDCTTCHNDGRSWNDYPEKKWLSAMPMYDNSKGPNSHYRHLFTGFSCDDCHYDTIRQSETCADGQSACSSCTDCHNDTIPLGDMSEEAHINPLFHVNKTKNVVFKDGGTYYKDASGSHEAKSCSSTICHTGAEPVWGGSSVRNNIVCMGCHGVVDADVDDFGKYNGIRAKINLNEWSTTGHGRPGTIDPATGLPDLSIAGEQYDSGNPPANFQENGCWYCHDSSVLHQDNERPFRLIQHGHFETRFELECVYCHMEGKDYECQTCHNVDPTLEYGSLAPQLDVIPADQLIARPDHATYNQGGTIGGESSCLPCHGDDTTRHNTGAGIWDVDKKSDVMNAYVKMGVCLICHDDDSSGECTACHSAPPENPGKYDLGFDPADLDPELVTGGKIGAQVSKASSSHFGYKHYEALTASTTDIILEDTVSDNGTSTATILDTVDNGGSANAWIENDWLGRRVEITYLADGVVETRHIVKNTATTITVGPKFSRIPMSGDTYKVINIVWKGGKFCWDCHDPHGDNNIYMVQSEVATRTDGISGRPLARKPVVFTRKSKGTDYAVSVPNEYPDGSKQVDGICNVCHTDSSMHYTDAGGDGHNSGRICTECHEHRFTNSHASGQDCDTCHYNKPVPRHTAFGQARDCTKCHKDSVNNRMNIMKQFSANSHHVQADKVTNKHCYACHWEATKEGVINTDFHGGYNYRDHSSVKNDVVDLVVWGAGQRPTEHNQSTAVTFDASKIDIWSAGTLNTLGDQRGEVSNVTTHCLGCHSDQNNETKPFDMADLDHKDCKTPIQYAWDRSSIDSRYGNTGKTTFGKYTGPNVAEKAYTKAFSAHGNAVENEGGWSDGSSGTGEDETVASTRSGIGNLNVQCFDCHSSHGSNDEGITSSYVTFNGTNNGGNLKETQKDKGGYPMNYTATANPNPSLMNQYQAGAGQCFDCHETELGNTQVGMTSWTPWGYGEVFGATAPIMGYRDSSRFGNGDRGATKRFSYRKTAIAGGHFRASDKNTDPEIAALGLQPVPAMGTINGLCTPCHDPHGVSASLGDKKEYAVPMLKGTWMTSPYKEDSPSSTATFANRHDQFIGTPPMQDRADGRGSGAWRSDRNTFNQADLSVKGNYPVGYDRVGEEAEDFAGLCLRCHPKSSLTSEVSAQATENVPWKTKGRIHRSVKGWGWNDGDDPREHSYTCSKCHSAHVSGLPRLMKTNCLNFAHRGGVETGGVSPISSTFGGFPYGWWTPGIIENRSGLCHAAGTANGSGGFPNNQGWNNVTPWTGGN